jgi:hypothetical protein
MDLLQPITKKAKELYKSEWQRESNRKANLVGPKMCCITVCESYLLICNY